MPVLSNSRHEAFARALFENRSADESYVLAGYSENRGNAARLKANENIQSRVAELQSEAARDSAITVESICRELDEANAVAREKGQASAMVNASALRARLAGLLTQKIEITDQRGEYDEPDEVVVARLAQYCGGRRKLTETETVEATRHFRELFEQLKSDFAEFICALTARPISGSHEIREIGAGPE